METIYTTLILLSLWFAWEFVQAYKEADEKRDK
jgi:hypothetical protein